MNRQSTVIFGTLILCFVVFITVRGDLPAWLALFTKGGTHPKVSATPASSGGSGGDFLSTLLGVAKTGAKIAKFFI